MKKTIIATLVLLVINSCQDPAKTRYDQSIIDREKIDSTFHKDVSKILLDHLYVVVDSVTYLGLTKNKQWKNAYGALDMGLPSFTAVKDHSSTCYLRGHHHYIEILGPNNKYNEPIGKSGIGFSLKNSDEHFHLGVKPKLKVGKDSFLYASEVVTMPLGEREHTWFKAFYTPSPGTGLHTWYGFYNPEFLDNLYGQPHNSYSREAFLKPNYKDEKLFNSIKEISLYCTLADYRRIAKELSSLRCRLIEKKDNRLTIASGDVIINITLSKEIEYSRITNITCRLNDHDNSNITLGNLTITNHGHESIWNFDKLHENNP